MGFVRKGIKDGIELIFGVFELKKHLWRLSDFFDRFIVELVWFIGDFVQLFEVLLACNFGDGCAMGTAVDRNQTIAFYFGYFGGDVASFCEFLLELTILIAEQLYLRFEIVDCVFIVYLISIDFSALSVQ